ncbi:MAG: type I DNA topoisomerase [Bacilli bacterium]
MKLIIVESPHKSQIIGKFLDSEYTVLASKGHVRDLASSGKMGLGVDVDNGFKPNYVIPKDKVAVVKQLKEACKKADQVFLATDPDREGEAIAWHLAQVLGLDVNTIPRLEFHEITKPAILKALDNPKTIDLALVESQETRRIIDRLMGYRLSNLLQKKLKSRSAGRVQSVVLKLLVEKEKEIQAFVPTEYWTINADFITSTSAKIKADLNSYKGVPAKIANEGEADGILKSLPEQFTISSVKSETKYREPQAAFTTASLQQAAFSHFHFTTKRTSAIAQKLYEGTQIDGTYTGLITYIRTDSIRLSDEYISAAKDLITEKYGTEYIGKGHHQKTDKNVQDAHEAIRPTNIDYTPSIVKPYLSNEEYQLYTLIYDRALASIMASRCDNISTVTFLGNEATFTASSTRNVFPGYDKVYEKYEEEDKENKLPELKEGDQVTISNPEKIQHFTKAPNRYNEGKVVKVMQDDGIGRPSTYSATITNLLNSEYIESKKGSLVPTEQGILTSDQLEQFFPKYMDVNYTANMETKLDMISEGQEEKNELLVGFWSEFCNYFESAMEKMEKVKPVEVGRQCPVCSNPLVIRHGKYGDFVGCSNYPACNYIEKPEQEYIEDRVCPDCGGKLIKRHSKRGEFVGCSNYPKCRYLEDLDGNRIVKEKKEIVIPDDAPICPSCHVGHLIEKTSRYGKTFIGCSNYPKCHYIKKDENAPESKPKRRYSKKTK